MTDRTISRYEVLGEIARGGMGIIYRARDPRLGREIALKVLPPELVGDEDRRRRFELEARATARLEHPHIAVIHEVGESGPDCFIAMELIRGEPLQDRLERDRLTPTRALELATEIAEGLRFAHDEGILHRDLKPGNVMVTEDGHIKIIDFGLAKLLEPDAPSASEENTAIRGETEPGKVVGTVAYMSPEQLRGLALDARSDLFSFGVLLYEMLSGERPFQGSTGADIASSLLRDPPPSLPDLGADVVPEALSELQKILEKCLAKEPDERYQSARDLIVDLKRARRLVEPGLRSSSASASALSPSGSPLRGLGLALALLVFLALSGSLIFRALRSSGDGSANVDRPVGRPAQSSVAVLGFKNLSGRDDTEWLSTALSEMLGTELSLASNLRIVSGEEVSRMKVELDLADADSFAGDTLARIRGNLGTDFIVVGSYTALGAERDTRIRVDLRLQDALAGQTVASMAESGTQAELFELVERAGNALRRELGLGGLSADDVSSVRATMSSNPRATRLYAEGLAKLRSYDAVEARALLEQAVLLDPDYALAHAALARAWTELGYDANAAESARRAFGLAEGLPREQYLSIQALSYETAAEWDKAVETYEVLWAFLPDSLDQGMRLARAQIQSGRSPEAIRTLASLRNLPPPLGDDPRVDLLEADAAETLSDYKRMVDVADTAIAKARAQEAWTLVAEAQLLRGSALRDLGRAEEAAEAFREAKRLFLDADDQGKVARVVNLSAILLKDEGDISGAEKLYRESLEIHRRTGNRKWVSISMNNLSLAVLERGQLRASRSMLEESLQIDREIRDPYQEALHLGNLAWVLFEEADLAQASVMTDRAFEVYAPLDSKGGLAECYFMRGRIHLARGELGEAQAEFEKTLGMWQEMGDRGNVAFARHGLGEVLLAKGDLAAAKQAFEEAQRIRTELEQNPWEARTALSLAHVAIEMGKPEDAERLAKEASSALGGIDPDDALTQVVVLTEALLARRQTQQARTAFADAESRASASERPTVRLEVGLTAARLLAAEGDSDAAGARFHRLSEEADELGLIGPWLRARLELAKLSPSPASTSELAADAERRGYGLIAKKAKRLQGASDSP